LLIIFPLTSFSTNNVKNHTPVNKVDINNEKQSLELDKLNYEVIKLKKETEIFGYSGVLQGGTLIAAICAALVSFWSAWRTSNLQSKTLQDQRSFNNQERIALMVGELGSEMSPVRLATVQSLKNYDGTAEFICNMLRFEKNSAVIRGAISSLQKHPIESATVLNNQSKLLFKDILNLGTKLIVLGVSKDDVATRICTTKEALRKWSEESEGLRTERELKSFVKLQGSSINTADLINETYKKLSDLMLAHNNTILAIESIIQRATELSLTLSFEGANLQGIILDNLDLSRINFSGTNLTNASLINTRMVNAQLNDITFHNTNINHSDFSGSNFINGDFKNVSAKHTIIRNAYFETVNFYKFKTFRYEFDGTEFKGCSFTESDFRNGNGRKVILNNCKTYKAHIDTSRLSEVICNDVKFSFSNIENNRLRRAELTDISMYNSKCKNLKMKGARISESKFIKGEFIRQKGEKPKIYKTKFDRCTFA
jgi:uncharacterized protein YjbI with pentapeptide repeats